MFPCLNEEANIENCIKKAFNFIKKNNINGEVLVIDNGSTDNSVNISLKNKARVIIHKNRGYGNALRKGIENAKGKYIIMADSDDSYDIEHLDEFYYALKKYDFVIGNRFKGKIKKGAMPFLNKYVGNPILSFIPNVIFKTNYDYHCGLRGGNKKKLLDLNLETTGMEFASEMVIKAVLNNYKIKEIPTILFCSNKRKSHLNPVRDGIRHLKVIFILTKTKYTTKI